MHLTGESLPTPTSAANSQEFIAIVDYGSQYTQLIARRVREAHVYCELVPPTGSRERLATINLKGVILSGGPASVYEPNAPDLPIWLDEVDVPVLAICYGMQLIAHRGGGAVAPAERREYGHARVHVEQPAHSLFSGLSETLDVWMSHGDRVDALPVGFRAIASGDGSPSAAIADGRGRIGLQFHPEVVHTTEGRRIIQNFLIRLCGCSGQWTPDRYIEAQVASIGTRIGDGRAICALSGGVDSAVAAVLVDHAIGDRLACILVDTGLMRRNECVEVMDAFRDLDLNVAAVDASADFYADLAGVVDPEEKRRRIGARFIKVFDREAERLDRPGFLVQGTLYPDVIESSGSDNPLSATIKTHHNVGGLPKSLPFTLVEPLRFLFKDEVREVGRALGLPEAILARHPFPGPGLAVRILGEVRPERVARVRAADAIVIDEIRRAGLYDEIWQAFAVLTAVQTVGVMGDGRTYSDLVAVRAVTSEDAMTADWARIPFDVLSRISSRIVNEVPGVNRVVYDVSSKPPSTIEWE